MNHMRIAFPLLCGQILLALICLPGCLVYRPHPIEIPEITGFQGRNEKVAVRMNFLFKENGQVVQGRAGELFESMSYATASSLQRRTMRSVFENSEYVGSVFDEEDTIRPGCMSVTIISDFSHHLGSANFLLPLTLGLFPSAADYCFEFVAKVRDAGGNERRYSCTESVCQRWGWIPLAARLFTHASSAEDCYVEMNEVVAKYFMYKIIADWTASDPGVGRLAEIRQLLDAGVISEEEYKRELKKLQMEVK